MTIADKRYGAELVTKKGKVTKYDAVECLINSIYNDEIVDAGEIHSLWVIDFSDPGVLADATKCNYLQSSELPSPMGMFITPVLNKEKLSELTGQYIGEVYTWNEIIQRVINQQRPEQ